MEGKKKRILLISIGSCMLALIIGGALFLGFYKADFNQELPMTETFHKSDIKQEDIAYTFLYKLMQPYLNSDAAPFSRLIDTRFNRFQLLAGDNKDFAIEATFWVKPENQTWSVFHNWGNKQEDGTIQDVHWTMRIKNTGKNQYTLTKIEETSNTISGLAPVKENVQKEAGVKVTDENNRCQIENGRLKVTYDNGKHWRYVPVNPDLLFTGDYSGPKDTLIPGSFIISPTKTAFIFIEKEIHRERVKVIYSADKGVTWKKSTVPGTFPSVRMRILGFTSNENGYLILTSERTMSWEAHTVFKTNNGGETWKHTDSVPNVNSLVTGGSFVNDKLGFISFGSRNVQGKQPVPYLFRSGDGGRTWSEVEVPVPPEYQGIFTIAETPIFDGSQGTLLVNQGPNGDFQGGKVLARYISIDEGMTWHFSNLVDPDQVISK